MVVTTYQKSEASCNFFGSKFNNRILPQADTLINSTVYTHRKTLKSKKTLSLELSTRIAFWQKSFYFVPLIFQWIELMKIVES